jgi:hypothetical protein
MASVTLPEHRPEPTGLRGRRRAGRRVIVLLAGGLCALGVVGGVAWAVVRPRTYTLKSGTIVALDLARRTGTVEFMLKSGQVQRVEAYVPEGCPILIDNQPGTIEQVRPGDSVAAVVTRYANQIRARQVEIFHAAPAAPASPPASAPAGLAPPGAHPGPR